MSVPSESRLARADGELRTDMLRLFALVVESVQVATAALLEADLQAVTRVLEGDARIDQLTHSIEARTYELLAHAGGEAVRLRCLVAILRIAQELERTGDLMTSVAKAARRLYPNPLDPRARGIIERMRAQATLQLQVATDAYAEWDAARAEALSDMDDVMDELQAELFRAVVVAPGGSEDAELAVRRAVQVGLISRFYERAADHAVNVGERVAYMVTGRFPGREGEEA